MTTDLNKLLTDLEQTARRATSGKWVLCHHLQSEENDKKCPCGFHGDIWGSDQEHIVCSIGVPHMDASSEMMPRYERSLELANAKHIVSYSPQVALALIELVRLYKGGLDWAPILYDLEKEAEILEGLGND